MTVSAWESSWIKKANRCLVSISDLINHTLMLLENLRRTDQDLWSQIMWQWQTLNRKKCFKLSFKDTELKKQGMWHLHFSCRHYQWHSLCPSQWGFDTTTKLQNKATATKGCFSISHPKNCKLGLSCIFVAKNNASNNQPF